MYKIVTSYGQDRISKHPRNIELWEIGDGRWVMGGWVGG